MIGNNKKHATQRHALYHDFSNSLFFSFLLYGTFEFDKRFGRDEGPPAEIVGTLCHRFVYVCVVCTYVRMFHINFDFLLTFGPSL